MDQAVLDGFTYTRTVFLAQFNGAFDLDDEIVHAWQRVFDFFAGHVYTGSLERQFVFAQVLSRVEARAGSKRSKQEFRGSHALVKVSLFYRLIASEKVATGMNLELHGTHMFHGDFHDALNSGAKDGAAKGSKAVDRKPRLTYSKLRHFCQGQMAQGKRSAG